jgi:hypothetical protein
MKHRFVHEFEDDPPLSDFEVDLDAPQGAIWLSADRAGWLHLARICSEMALHTVSSRDHFHRSYDWEDFPARRRMVSFELSEEKDPA